MTIFCASCATKAAQKQIGPASILPLLCIFTRVAGSSHDSVTERSRPSGRRMPRMDVRLAAIADPNLQIFYFSGSHE